MGLPHKHIHADMVATLGDDAPALSPVQKWAAEFKRGIYRRALKTTQGPDVLPQPPPKKDIDRVHHMVMDDIMTDA